MHHLLSIFLVLFTAAGGAHHQHRAQDAHAVDAARAQVGLASFYGPGFAGQPTASGKIFNPAKMVAAHPTLPLGTTVRVTNLENGRSVVLRIIDRGPYGRNRRKGCIIDVSKGAARRLGFIRQGLTAVRVRVLALGRH